MLTKNFSKNVTSSMWSDQITQERMAHEAIGCEFWCQIQFVFVLILMRSHLLLAQFVVDLHHHLITVPA